MRTGVDPVDAVLDEAVGRGHRRDPVVAGTDGPAGNALLTSWVGLLMVVLIAGEVATLLDVFGLIEWHVGIGLALTALVLLKTASTGWRILRYYTGSSTYVSAGPPPLLLRLLGPPVIVGALGVLGSGIALIAVGPTRSRLPWISVVGHPLTLGSVHAGFFVLFAIVTGLHVLARFAPAVSLVCGRPRRPPHPSRPGQHQEADTRPREAVRTLVGAYMVCLIPRRQMKPLRRHSRAGIAGAPAGQRARYRAAESSTPSRAVAQDVNARCERN